MAKKIKDWLNNIVTNLKQLLDNTKANSPAAKIIEKNYNAFKEVQKQWNAALISATENFNNVSEDYKSGNNNSDLVFSIKETQKMDWNEQLNQVEKKELNGSNALYIGTMNNLESAGFSNNPFAMNQSDYRKSRRKNTKNKNYSKHAIPLKFFKEIQNHLNNSVMFIDNGDKVTVITDSLMLDTKGQPSYIVAGVWQNQKMRQDTVNQIKSVYPLDDFASRLLESAKKGSLVITNKNKANNMLSGIGVQPSEREDIINLAKNSLSQDSENVKNGEKNSLRDSEYMSAVENGDTETAQRLVDEAAKQAGYTIKAYHGTTNQEEKSVWNSKTRTYDTTYTPIRVFKKQYDEQVGHFFNDDIDNAGGYGSYLYSVYLKIDNPLVIDCNGQNYSAISFDGKEMDTYEWADYAKKKRYDGVIFKNISDGVDYDDLSKLTTDYVVFNSNQIKSADTITYDNSGNVIPLSERFDDSKSDIRFSKRDNVVDENGNVYSKVIEINQDIFKGIKPREWKKPLRSFVQNKLAGQQITVFDNNGNEKVIEFARKNERIRKKEDKNNRKVLGKLENKKDRNSQLAVANSAELIEVSFYSSENKEHSHQWLDENGWEFRKSYMMLPEGQIYEVTLNIGKTKDGRNILYDINKIRQVGRENLAKMQSADNTYSANNYTLTQDSENVNGKNSLRDTNNYSYDELISKPDMNVVTITEDFAKNGNAVDRKGILQQAKKTSSVYIKDLKENVNITRKGILHFTEKTIKLSSNAISDTATITPNIAKILENSIVVNELKARENKNQDIKKSFVLIGIATDTNNDYLVRTIVDKYTNDVLECDFYNLYATKAKKEEMLGRSPSAVGQKSSDTVPSLTISISDLLKNVKDVKLVASVLSKDVCKKLGIDRPDSVFKDSLKYSLRDNEIFDREQIEDIIKEQFGSFSRTKAFKENVLSDMAEKLDVAYTMMTDRSTADNGKAKLKSIAKEIYDKTPDSVKKGDNYIALRDEIQSYGIKITDEIKSELGDDYNNFLHKNMNRLNMRFANKGSLDEAYEDLSVKGMLSGEAQGPAEMLREMADTLDGYIETDGKFRLENKDEIINEITNNLEQAFNDVDTAPKNKTDRMILSEALLTAAKDTSEEKALLQSLTSL